MKHLKSINEGLHDKLEYCNECKMLMHEHDKGDNCNYCSVLEIVGGSKEDYGQLKYHDKFKGNVIPYLEKLKDKYNLSDDEYNKIISIFK